MDDTALDLAICMAVIGSLKDQIISNLKCFIAEVGLGGELRNVQRIQYRVAEVAKLGFKEVFIAAQQQPFSKSFGIKINCINNLKELIAELN